MKITAATTMIRKIAVKEPNQIKARCFRLVMHHLRDRSLHEGAKAMPNSRLPPNCADCLDFSGNKTKSRL
jgi:hypothetical protein